MHSRGSSLSQVTCLLILSRGSTHNAATAAVLTDNTKACKVFCIIVLSFPLQSYMGVCTNALSFSLSRGLQIIHNTQGVNLRVAASVKASIGGCIYTYLQMALSTAARRKKPFCKSECVCFCFAPGKRKKLLRPRDTERTL